jgi:hypothetical protein
MQTRHFLGLSRSYFYNVYVHNGCGTHRNSGDDGTEKEGWLHLASLPHRTPT